jgi:hypothetical protein
MEYNKCPICEKPGIGDYKKHKINCSNCDTDLSVFVAIENAYQDKTHNKYLYLTLSILLVSLITIGWIFNSLSNSKDILNQYMAKIEGLNSALNSKDKAINELKDSLIVFKNSPKTTIKTDSSTHIVKYGESFCSISYKYFKDYKHANNIAIINGKDIRSVIRPGMILQIPQK